MYIATDLGRFMVENVTLKLWTSRIGDKRVLFPVPRYTKKDVLFLRSSSRPASTGRSSIGCPLEGVVDATRYVETHQKTGNVVLTVSPGGAR